MGVECIIGLDLAGLSKNPSGIAILIGQTVLASLVYSDQEILETLDCFDPILLAIDAPLSEPKSGYSRTADRQMIQKGYRVFPPNFMHMRQLTLRAVHLNRQINQKSYKTIEVHPTSSRKALQILPAKEWPIIQCILKQIGLKGDLEKRTLVSHELDAVTAALTARLYLQNQTEQIGDQQEGYITVPKKRDWGNLKI